MDVPASQKHHTHTWRAASRRRFKLTSISQPYTDFLAQSTLMSNSHASNMSLDAYIESMLQEIFVHSATGGAGAVLDKRISKARCKMRVGVFQSKRPMTALLSGRPFQIFLIVMSAVLIGRATLSEIRQVNSTGMFEGRIFRFVAHELRQSRMPPENIVSVHDISLLRDSCRLEDRANFTVRGSTVWMEFDKPVKSNGWMFTTSTSDPNFDPVIFSLEACSAPDMCTTVGGTDWQYKYDGELQVSTHRRFDVPLSRLHDIIFDYKLRYTALLFPIAAQILGIGAFATLVATLIKVRRSP